MELKPNMSAYCCTTRVSDLNEDCLKHIFYWMTLIEKVAIERVSKQFLNVIRNELKYEQTKLTFGSKYTALPEIGLININRYKEELLKQENLVIKARKSFKSEKHIESLIRKTPSVCDVRFEKVPLMSSDLVWLVRQLPKLESIQLKCVYWGSDDDDFNLNWLQFCNEIGPRLRRFSFQSPTVFYRSLTFDKLHYLVESAPFLEEFNFVGIRVTMNFTLSSAIRLINSLPEDLLGLHLIPDKKLSNEIYSMLGENSLLNWNHFSNLVSLKLGLIHSSLIAKIGHHLQQLEILAFSLGPESDNIPTFSFDWFPKLKYLKVRVQSLDCTNPNFGKLIRGLNQFGSVSNLKSYSLRCKKLSVDQFRTICSAFHDITEFAINCSGF